MSYILDVVAWVVLETKAWSVSSQTRIHQPQYFHCQIDCSKHHQPQICWHLHLPHLLRQSLSPATSMICPNKFLWFFHATPILFYRKWKSLEGPNPRPRASSCPPLAHLLSCSLMASLARSHHQLASESWLLVAFSSLPHPTNARKPRTRPELLQEPSDREEPAVWSAARARCRSLLGFSLRYWPWILWSESPPSEKKYFLSLFWVRFWLN